MTSHFSSLPSSRALAVALLLGITIPGRAETVAVTTIHGIVVDGSKRPVAKATVEARHFRGTRKTTTDAKGLFTLTVPTTWSWGLLIVASLNNGQQQAYQRLQSETEGQKQQPLRLVLRTARRMDVRVVDEKGQPIPKAQIGAIADWARFGSTTTDATGKATYLIPADATLQTLYAWKRGKGLDYRAYTDRQGQADSKVKPPSSRDGAVVLTLDGATTVQVRVQDDEGRPIANLPLYLWYLQKPNQPANINLSMLVSELQVKTNEKGVAVLDWLPVWEKNLIAFFPISAAYAHRRILYDPKTGKGRVIANLERLVPIRGRVLFPDGKPATGIRITSAGAGYGDDQFHQQTQTDKDGRFELRAYPNQIYLVIVDDKKWAAPPRTGFAVLPNRPVNDLDFRLRPATRVHGRVTMGKDKTPIPGQQMFLTQHGKDLHSLKGVTLPNPGNSREWIQPTISRAVTTDKDGRYEFFLGPGEYVLRGPNQTEAKKFTIKDEKSLVLDFHALRPEKGRLTGLVVTGNPPKPVADAEVTGIYRHSRAGGDLKVKTDKEGRIDVTRKLYQTVVYARSSDKRLAGVVEITADDTAVTIPIQEMARATGRLVDPEGKPLADHEIWYGVRVPIGDDNAPWRMSFGGKIKTDKTGRFLLSGLVVGQLYRIDVTMDEHSWRTVGEVRAKDAQAIDLGNLTLTPAYRPPTLEERMAKTLGSNVPPQKRFATAITNARLSKQHVLVVFAETGSKTTRQFFQLRYEDREIRRAFDPYQIVAIGLNEKTMPAVREFAKHLNVRLEKRAFPLLVVYDTEEVQMAVAEGRVQRDKLMPFLKAHAPRTLDARKLLADALALARKEKKRVLVQETATWCPPCWALSRFLDRHRDLWSKDYLWIKIDHRWTHAKEVMDGIRKGYRGGIPWTAILDADGKVLITSNDAKGDNIGFPGNKQGIDHFISMIQKTAIRLTGEEIAKLRKALEQR